MNPQQFDTNHIPQDDNLPNILRNQNSQESASSRLITGSSYRRYNDYLFDYLEDSISNIRNHTIITWSTTRNLFVIHDRHRFEIEILPLFVKPSKDPSKTPRPVSSGSVYKKLRKQGFTRKRITNESFHLSHPTFVPRTSRCSLSPLEIFRKQIAAQKSTYLMLINNLSLPLTRETTQDLFSRWNDVFTNVDEYLSHFD